MTDGEDRANAPLVIVILTACNTAEVLQRRVRKGAERLSEALRGGRPGYILLSGCEDTMKLGSDQLAWAPPNSLFDEPFQPKTRLSKQFTSQHTRASLLNAAQQSTSSPERGTCAGRRGHFVAPWDVLQTR